MGNISTINHNYLDQEDGLDFAKWKFKNYNELNHEFHEKMMKSQDTAIEYQINFHQKLRLQ